MTGSTVRHNHLPNGRSLFEAFSKPFRSSIFLFEAFSKPSRIFSSQTVEAGTRSPLWGVGAGISLEREAVLALVVSRRALRSDPGRASRPGGQMVPVPTPPVVNEETLE